MVANQPANGAAARPAHDPDMVFIARKIREALDAASSGRRCVTLTIVITQDELTAFIGDGRGHHWRRPPSR